MPKPKDIEKIKETLLNDKEFLEKMSKKAKPSTSSIRSSYVSREEFIQLYEDVQKLKLWPPNPIPTNIKVTVVREDD